MIVSLLEVGTVQVSQQQEFRGKSSAGLRGKQQW
jgi:hypothetical protein